MGEAPRAVLELFTSQGCPNSPPADKLLSEFGKDPSVLTLAYHVEYWDYVGWRDTFGDVANSDRQRAYAARWGESRLYTPQLVVNGGATMLGSDRDAAESALKKAELPIRVGLSIADGILSIDVSGGGGVGKAVVWLVTYIGRAEVRIEGGDNAGRILSYSNVVTNRRVLAEWETSGVQLKLPVSAVFDEDSDGAIILVQEAADGLPGRIRGAASIEQEDI